MLLCFFLRAEESKMNGAWGYPPAGGTLHHSRPSLGALNLCAREKDSFARLSLAEQGVALRETLGTGPPVTLLAFGFAMSQLRLSPLFH